MTARVYVATHKQGPLPRGDLLLPIQVGRENPSKVNPDLSDSSGDNISSLNPFFCEMTAAYWAWKNDTNSSFIGLFHYRRYLSLSSTVDCSVEPKEGTDFIWSPSSAERKFGLNQSNFQKTMNRNRNLIAAVPTRRDLVADGFSSLQEQYEILHNPNDLHLATEILEDIHPEQCEEFRNHLAQPLLNTGNIFIFSRATFFAYANWIFPMLFAIHDSLDYSQRNPREKRAVGFLSERLTSFFIDGLVAEQKIFLPRIFLRSPDLKSRSAFLNKRIQRSVYRALR